MIAEENTIFFSSGRLLQELEGGICFLGVPVLYSFSDSCWVWCSIAETHISNEPFDLKTSVLETWPVAGE